MNFSLPLSTREAITPFPAVTPDRLAAVNVMLVRYADFLSHDLRSPLTAIQGYLGLLEESSAQIPAELRPLLQQAIHASQIMGTLIADQLQIAEAAADGRVSYSPPMDPTPTLRRLIGHMRWLPARPRVEFVLREPLPALAVSPAALERIFFPILVQASRLVAGTPRPVVTVSGDLQEGCPVLRVEAVPAEAKPRTAGSKRGWNLKAVAPLLHCVGGKVRSAQANDSGSSLEFEFPANA